MKNFNYVRCVAVAASLAVLLSGCGGGGGGSSGATAPPTACGIKIVADTSVAAGKTAGAAALSCGAPLTSITWSRVSGPTVSLLAANTPTVAVETSTTGTISLKADAVLADGSSASATTDIVVNPAPSGSYVTVRADHSLRPGTDTSVRAWPVLAGNDSLSNIVWTQIAGPTVTMDTSDERVMMFTAPASGTDVALKFRATMTTSFGKVDSDDVIVSLDHQVVATDSRFPLAARVHPYRLAGAYAGVLARCSYDASLYYTDWYKQNLCSVDTLPLLAHEAGIGNVPTVAQIMGRVLVSHDFLGANFEAFLTNQDVNGDFRRLLAGVTSIVIGSHVRPSFYTPATGAIYLDAGQLWLTPEQRDVVTEVPDYRLAFDDALNFTGVGRMVKNNDYVQQSYLPTARVSRPAAELIFQLGRLMYHELGHAGDFFPVGERNLDGSMSILGNVVGRLIGHTLPSDVLATAYPLTSNEMKGLGQVMYIGATPTALQKSYTAAQVGAFFASDVATDDYAYAIHEGNNSREDLAMLMEEFWMAYRHNVQYDVAYTNKYVDGMTSADLIVAWGQRGRVGHPSIKPRVKLVLAQVAPWINPSVVDALPAPIQMTPGTNWDQALVQLGAAPMTGPSPSPLLNVTSATAMSRARDDVIHDRHAH